MSLSSALLCVTRGCGRKPEEKGEERGRKDCRRASKVNVGAVKLSQGNLRASSPREAAGNQVTHKRLVGYEAGEKANEAREGSAYAQGGALASNHADIPGPTHSTLCPEPTPHSPRQADPTTTSITAQRGGESTRSSQLSSTQRDQHHGMYAHCPGPQSRTRQNCVSALTKKNHGSRNPSAPTSRLCAAVSRPPSASPTSLPRLLSDTMSPRLRLAHRPRSS